MLKYHQRILNNLKTNYKKSVLIYNDGHDKYYWDATSYDALMRTSLQILKRMHEDNWFQIADNEPEKPQYDLESLKALKSKEMRSVAEYEWKQYENAINRRAEAVERLENVQQALLDTSGELAYLVLRDYLPYDHFVLEGLKS